MIEKEQAPNAAIVVLATLADPHRFVAMSAKVLRKTKADYSVVRCRDRRCLDIAVCPSSLDRALRLMDALLKALDARELHVEITDVRAEEPYGNRYREPRPEDALSNVTRVKVADEWIQFAVSEKISHHRPPPPPAPKGMNGIRADFWQRLNRPPIEYVPTGVLTLSITNAAYLPVTSSWRDGKRRQLEACLNEFVATLHATAEAMKAQRAQQAKAQKERDEAEKRRWEEQRRREAEARHAKELEAVVAQWRLAHEIRAYVAEARSMVADADLTMADGSPFDRWLTFAAGHAETIDPLAGLRADVARVLAEKAEIEGNTEASLKDEPAKP